GSLSNLDANAGKVTYTPDAGYSGADSFNYHAHNAGGDADKTVHIDVTTTITVNTTSDVAPTGSECSGGANDCSLRQALDKATTGDAIFLPANASSYAVTLGEIAYGTDGLTILGAGARQSVIQGNGSSRIFNV